MTRKELRQYLIEKSMDPYRDPQTLLQKKLETSKAKEQRMSSTLKGAIYGGTWSYAADLLSGKARQQ